MSQRIPEETIQDILYRADIVEVIGDYVPLTQRGANCKGLCPFHQEKTPSFTVNPAKGVFHCFGCQASGNVIGFVMQHDHLTFPEAVRLLAERYGVPIPETGDARQPTAWQQLYRLHQAALEFFHRTLVHDAVAQPARAYCRQRHLSAEVITRFGLGYAPDAWEQLTHAMQRQGFSQELLIQSGLAVAREHRGGVYDRFRHRLMFPIYDRQGRPVAFGGRVLEGDAARQGPKYLNSPESPVFHKGRTLYGFHLAKAALRQNGRGILVEGYTDVVACHRQGVTHAIGTLGTALTVHHVEMLKGLTKEIILIFDADTAGGAATERSIGLLLDGGLRVRVVELPEGEDPASFLLQHSGADLLHRVEESCSFLDYLIRRARRVYDLHTPAGQADCVARIVPLLHKIDDHVEHWGYVASLAEQLGLPLDVIQRQMQSKREAERGRPEGLPPARVPHAFPGPREEYLLIQEVGHDLSFLPRVQQQITPDAFANADLGAIFASLLRVAPQCQGVIWPQLLHEIEHPGQRQIVSKMAMESLVSGVDERAKAVDDCLTKMQRRQMKARRQRVINQLYTASGEAERLLLQEIQRLQQKGEGGASVQVRHA